MRYANVINNDIVSGDGLSVSFFTQGCPHRCQGCHNPDTWDFDGGKEFKPEVLYDIVKKLNAQGIHRNLCIMGGEPLCDTNLFLTSLLIKTVKDQSPHTKIYLWTGYTREQLLRNAHPHMKYILDYIDVLIDGLFEESLRDITLPLRGSSNQKIYTCEKGEWHEAK